MSTAGQERNDAMTPSLPIIEITRSGHTAKFHGSWYRGETTNFIPSKRDLEASDAVDRYVVPGWTPSVPVIRKDTRVLAFGSCFAAHITEHLHDRGFCVLGRHLDLDAHIIRFGEGMVNSFAMRQQLEWALDGKEIPEGLWFSEHKDVCAADPALQEQTRQIILSADAFVFTLGVSEIWYDKRNGEALWRAVPAFLFDGQVHGFRVSTVAENYANLARMRELIRRIKPTAPIIFTLSPVPLMATFRPVSCVTASSVSKAILRVSIDELMRAHADDPNLLYFPSYEIVKEYFVDPYLEDNRHPRPEVVSFVMNTFERHYCGS
jgi:hypothetical protein